MIITRTPFRVSFFGGGSDYPVWYEDDSRGAVLSASINKYCYITCRKLPPFFEHKSRVVWSKIESVKHVDEIQHPAVREVIKHLGISDGLEIHHDGDLPARSGLGSSSTFTVGLLNALYALQGKMVSKHQLALEAIHVEQNLLKENVGAQDQTAAAFGGLNKIEFGGPHKIAVHPVAISAARYRELQDHCMLFFTGLARTASEVAAEQIKNTPKKKAEIGKMVAMVDEAIGILNGNGPIEDFGRLLHETWMLKRGLSSQISSSMIDDIYNAARSAGAIGGKILGAGGGGFILFFATPELQPKIRERLKHLLHVPFRFENMGSQIIHYGPEHNF